MHRCSDLLEKARQNPAGVRFSDLYKLAECHDWQFARQKGAHRLYTRPGSPRLMNFQEGPNGMSKSYQVKQLLNWIDENAEAN
jgi:hypothetical protein